MSKKLVSTIMLVLLALSTVVMAFDVAQAEAIGVIYIRADGSIDPPTAPILHDGSVYSFTGNITSDTNGIIVERDDIVLDGEGYTIQGIQGMSRGIDLSYRSNVTIRDMKVKGFWQAGIYQWFSSDVCIFGCDIVSNTVSGIIGYESNCSSISENNLENNDYGIYFYGRHYYNRIFENNITANGAFGIGLDNGWGADSYNNDVYRNNITANYGNVGGFRGGIFLRGKSNNSIHENNIVDNWCGIYLNTGSNNTIYNNNFIANTYQVRDAHSDYSNLYPSINTWDDGYPSGGNYWEEYAGVDLKSGPNQDQPGSDGIIDTPYEIYTNNVDEYPSVLPFSGFRWVWGDEDNDGILNYLDSDVFIVDESLAQSAYAFETVATPIKITHLLPSLGYGQVMAALHEWGVKETPIKRLMRVFVVDVSNVRGVLSWLRKNGLISDDFNRKALSFLCADGHWRSLWVIRSDLDVFETCKAILEFRKSTLHPDLLFDAITRIINLFDVEFYTLRGSGSVTASLSLDFASSLERLASARKYLKELFISASTIVGMALTAIATGSFAGLALQFGAKLINFILDYFIFDYVESAFLEFIKIWMMAIDPPGDRVVLQLFDASGQTLLIGHNQTLDEDVCIFEHGAYSADNDSAILLVSRTGLDYNFTVTTTPTTVTPLPYTMIHWDCTENETIVTGGLLDSHQSFSTRLNLTNNKLDMSYLSIAANLSNENPQPGEQVEVSINVTDDGGTPYSDCGVALLIANVTILAQNQGNGFFNATIDTAGMAGFYNLTIFTINPPTGFLQGVTTLALEVGPHDIAVTNTSLSKNILGLGYELVMNLTLQNEGFFAETFNLTIYANATVITSITNVALAMNDSITLTQEIATSGWVCGNYSIWACVMPVSGETDMTDNNSTRVHVIVSIPGDVNGDRKVDQSDLVDLNKAYGSTFGSPTWNANCDVNGDNKVDALDLFIHGKNYGKTDP